MAIPTTETDSSTLTSPPLSILLTSSAPTPLQNVHHHISEKFTQENYILWRFLMVPFLEGQNLFGHVDGSTPRPPQLVPDTTSSLLIANPGYQTWYHQDRMIFSAIISTLSVEALPHVIGLSTSREVWLTLETLFSAQSQSRILQLKQQLATLKKGAQSISAYFQKAQGFSHLLAAIGKPVDASELVSNILAGLGPDYDPLVTSVTTRQDSISLNGLYGYMLSYELRLEQHKSAIDLNISTANTAQRQSPSHPRNNRGSNPGYRNNFSQGRGRGRGRGPPQQFPSSGPSSFQRPTCQVCHKQGHTAATCWFQFEQDYQPASPSLHANMASTSPATDSSWYPDTGANVHLTNDLSNLNLHAKDYIGMDKICVRNGQGLEILHSGCGLLPTPSHTFQLFSLLHVPKIQKNLISVNQFTRDNHVFIEFHPKFFCVKDLKTRQLLLQGPSKLDFYPWPSSHAPSSKSLAAFIGEKVSLDQWHLRLGHPASPIVSRVIQSNKLPVVSSKLSTICSSCQQGKSHRLHFSISPSISSAPLQLLFLDV